MNIIETSSFKISVNTSGDKNSEYLALLLPGRLDTKDYANFDSHLKYLADKGFYAVSFDPPGTWQSPGDISLFTTTNYIKAVNELIEYFGNRPTLLLGHSRGGAVSILSSINPHAIGLVLIMSSYEAPDPPESLGKESQVEFRDLPPGNTKTEAQKEFSLPMDYFKDGQKYDPLDVLKHCQKPKLLFSGTRDEYYSPEEVSEIYKEIPEPKMIHQLNCDHNYRYYPEIIDEVNDVTEEFINKYILKTT